MSTTNQLLQQGRFRITQPFEKNATGAFYKAFDEVQKTEVVLKETFVRLNKVTTPAQQEQLKQEFAAQAQKLTEMRHHAFQNVYGFFSEIDRQYLIMESIDGDNLAQLIERNKRPFALADVAGWADELLDALNYLHTQTPPVIHRDIKPQNIKLALDGRVRLDISNMGKSPQIKIGSTVTNQNLHFLPLEQIWAQLDSASQKVILNSYDEKSEEILKQPLDARSDIYAFGATLYYLLTARLPIDALERSIDLLEEKPDPLPSPSKLNPNVPEEISEAVMKALEIRRENRFESAAIMRQRLKTAFVRIREQAASKSGNASGEQFINISEHDILEIETEPIPQIDLIKRLQEAEARRLEAERRAAEAEKRLLENQGKQSGKTGNEAKPVENFAQALANSAASETGKTAFSDENSFLFAEEPKSGGMKKMLVAAAALIVLGGAGFGIWSFTQSSNIKADQGITNQIDSATTDEASPEPAVEQTTPAEPTPEIVSATPTTSEPETNEPAGNPQQASSPALRNRPAAPAASAVRPQKQAAQPPAKPATPEKKKITVDDLIKGN